MSKGRSGEGWRWIRFGARVKVRMQRPVIICVCCQLRLMHGGHEDRKEDINMLGW